MQINLYEDAGWEQCKKIKIFNQDKKKSNLWLWLYLNACIRIVFLTDKKCMTKCNDHIDGGMTKIRVWQ